VCPVFIFTTLFYRSGLADFSSILLYVVLLSPAFLCSNAVSSHSFLSHHNTSQSCLKFSKRLVLLQWVDQWLHVRELHGDKNWSPSPSVPIVPVPIPTPTPQTLSPSPPHPHCFVPRSPCPSPEP